MHLKSVRHRCPCVSVGPVREYSQESCSPVPLHACALQPMPPPSNNQGSCSDGQGNVGPWGTLTEVPRRWTTRGDGTRRFFGGHVMLMFKAIYAICYMLLAHAIVMSIREKVVSDLLQSLLLCLRCISMLVSLCIFGFRASNSCNPYGSPIAWAGNRG